MKSLHASKHLMTKVYCVGSTLQLSNTIVSSKIELLALIIEAQLKALHSLYRTKPRLRYLILNNLTLVSQNDKNNKLQTYISILRKIVQINNIFKVLY